MSGEDTGNTRSLLWMGGLGPGPHFHVNKATQSVPQPQLVSADHIGLAVVRDLLDLALAEITIHLTAIEPFCSVAQHGQVEAVADDTARE